MGSSESANMRPPKEDCHILWRFLYLSLNKPIREKQSKQAIAFAYAKKSSSFVDSRRICLLQLNRVKDLIKRSGKIWESICYFGKLTGRKYP